MLLTSHSAVHSSSNDKKIYLHVRIDKFMNYDKLKKIMQENYDEYWAEWGGGLDNFREGHGPLRAYP